MEQQSRTRMVKLYATESVSPSDRMDGRSESSRLKEHIITIITERGTTHFQYDFADVLDKTQFDRRMAEVELAISGEMENNDILPFLHISCHGTTDHLKFTNGEIFWDDLTKLIRRLTARCTGNRPVHICVQQHSGFLYRRKPGISIKMPHYWPQRKADLGSMLRCVLLVV